ncbi:MAG: outer membrane lipoprotein-sorting protein [Rhizobacter sp.]|nr:outer membrane lipoprotein-sorting protein [Rhizobacter sp.]
MTIMSAAVLTLAAAATAFAQDVPTLLKAADKYRMGAENMQVEMMISVFNSDGSPDKERRYTVFAQAKHQSLVLMQSPAEKGQKVLMLGDDFWLLMPNSQRPLRITPMQKLLSDASTGDIATMSWADDYSGTVAGEEPCGEPKQACIHLSLNANRKGVTYQRIELWLGKARHEPIKADLYVQSDKLAKQARFVMDKPSTATSAPTLVAEMLLRDQLTNKKETQVRYLGRKEKSVPEAWLNPMFLARNPVLE